MTTTDSPTRRWPDADEARAALLDGLPVTEHRITAAGVPTCVLEGGEGPPLVLLHGPGESAAKWLRIIPQLAATNTLVAPDLPGHANSDTPDSLDVDAMLAWLGALIDRTCAAPPVVVGHVLGGALAARFAVEHSDRLDRLVLVDTLGLAPFRPAPGFLLSMVGFLIRPTEGSYDRFMRQCSYDLDGLRDGMGERWQPFVAYNLHEARSGGMAPGRLLRKLGMSVIPPEDLARITVPTALIWGRQDRATKVAVAEEARDRYGWPLHVIDDCADDPPRDRPDAFLAALRTVTAPGRSAADAATTPDEPTTVREEVGR